MLGFLAPTMQRWLDGVGLRNGVCRRARRPGSSGRVRSAKAAASIPATDRVEGTFVGLDAGGALLMQRSSGAGSAASTFGDVMLAGRSGGCRLMADQRRPGGRAADELVFMALGGIGEIGMNCYLYGLGPAERPAVADGRSRHHLSGGRERSGRRCHPARSALHRGGARQPGRTGADPRARGPLRRRHRAVAAAEGADLCHAVHRGAAQDQARRVRRRRQAADPRGGPQQPLRCGAVRHRAHLRGALDPGVQCPGDPHAARRGAAHRRLEDRSHAGDRRRRPTSSASSRSAPRA